MTQETRHGFSPGGESIGPAAWQQRLLQNANYILDEMHDIWSKEDIETTSYSDGKPTEDYITESLLSCSDKSPLSDELAAKSRDWPTFYHFHKQRDSVLRAFEDLLKGKRCIELGSGCGAVTRYLGDTCDSTVAVEGSIARAKATRARTHGQANVEVVAGNITSLTGLDNSFDVAIAIGVLEYASIYSPSDSPHINILKKARELLKPDGILILAIENQLGLKYFAGAPEDHTGISHYGIEDRYKPGGPRTFGPQELTRLFVTAGFQATRVYGSFPDYKFASFILTEEGCNSTEFDPLPMIIDACSKDPQHKDNGSFSLTKAWRAVCRNRLSIQMANSHIVVASKSTLSYREEALGYYFSADRRRPFCKRLVFTLDHKRDAWVHSSYMCPEREETPFITHYLDQRQPYVRGLTLEQKFLHDYSENREAAEEELGNRYLEAVMSQAGHAAIPRFATISGKMLDLIPRNVILNEATDKLHVIDLEWQTLTDISVQALLYRGFINTARKANEMGIMKFSPSQLVEWAAEITSRTTGQALHASEIQELEEQEAILMALVQQPSVR